MEPLTGFICIIPIVMYWFIFVMDGPTVIHEPSYTHTTSVLSDTLKAYYDKEIMNKLEKQITFTKYVSSDKMSLDQLSRAIAKPGRIVEYSEPYKFNTDGKFKTEFYPDGKDWTCHGCGVTTSKDVCEYSGNRRKDG